MKVAILGYGVEGPSAYKYWKAKGADVVVHDDRADLQLSPDIPAVLGRDHWKNLGQYDVIVRSPSGYPRAILAANPETPDLAKRITSTTREFMAQCPAPIIGVTGTKGKGTTSTLISKILEAAGHKVWLGGNIGVPVLDFLPEVKPTDWVVLELSSFQLMDADRSPHIGVLLMIEPEHQNWHASPDEYYEAKGNLVRFQSTEDVAVYNARNAVAVRLAQTSPGRKVPYLDAAGAHVAGGWVMMGGERICPVDEVGLPGPHNLENVCAAGAATWDIVHDAAPVSAAIKAFTGLPFRLELVGEVDGVRYYNDSFGTTPETAIAAIRAFDAPKVIILGGSDKGSDYHQLARAVAEGGVRKVVLIGQMGPVIGRELAKAGFTDTVEGGATMTEIVAEARAAARPGDVVLLSPACASFGMFQDYKDRGRQFTAAVKALAS